MAYFKIGNEDFSQYVKSLKINRANNYNAQTNAAGDTVVDYINSKRTIEVGIIPLNNSRMLELQSAIRNFNVSISFHNPRTDALEENVNCIVPEDTVDFYTMSKGKARYNEFTLTFIEL